MKIYNDTTGKIILKELIKAIAWCSFFMIIVFLYLYFMSDTRPASITELLYRMEMPSAISETEIDNTYSVLAIPLGIFILIFITRLRALIIYCNPIKTNVKAVELLKDSVTFYFIDKRPPLSCPYEALTNITACINCFSSIPDPLYRYQKNIALTQIDIVFNFPNDNLEITSRTLQNCPMSLIKKILDSSRGKCKFLYSISGLDTELTTSYTERIEHYIQYGYKRFCPRNEKGPLIMTTFSLILVGTAAMLISLATCQTHKITIGEWLAFGIGALAVLISLYIDCRLVKDELFDHRTNNSKLLLTWIIPAIKILILTLSCLWFLKTNYYI